MTYCVSLSIVLAALGLVNGQQTVQLQCNLEGLVQCFDIAVNVAKATGCNTDIVMPWLMECEENEAGLYRCNQATIDFFLGRRIAFNTTLYNGAEYCNSQCTDQVGHGTSMIECTQQNGGLDQLASVLVQTGIRDPTNSLCINMKDILECMYLHAKDCPGLLSAMNETLYINPQVITAVRQCGQSPPAAPTTVRPLPQAYINTLNGGKALNGTSGDGDTGGYGIGGTGGMGTGGTGGTGGTDGTGPDGNYTGNIQTDGIPIYVTVMLAIGALMLFSAMVVGIWLCIDRRNKKRLLSRSSRSDDWDSRSVTSTKSARSYFNPPRYYFGAAR